MKFVQNVSAFSEEWCALIEGFLEYLFFALLCILKCNHVEQ